MRALQIAAAFVTVLMRANACQLSKVDAEQLVLLIPDAARVRQAKGCPAAEILLETARQVHIQLRNICPASGSGIIGNYIVDRNRGTVWEDLEGLPIVTSQQMRKIQARLLAKCREVPTRKPTIPR